MKKKNYLACVIFCSLLFGAALPIVSRAAAQVSNIDEIQKSALSLTAIPPRLGDDGTLQANPGETLQTEVRVRNSSSKAVRVSSIIEDFVIGEDGRTPVPVQDQQNSRWSLASWIQLSDTDQVVAPGASQTIPVVIQVPDDALPGGHYAMIMHEPKSDITANIKGSKLAGETGIVQRVGTLVYLRVEGNVKEEAFLRNISVPFFQEFGPVPISFSLENLSDIHVRPAATITIRDMFGRSRGKIDVPTQNVFPYTLRNFSANWDRVWGFGRYEAEISLQYGERNQALTQSVYFWLIPVKLLLALLTVCLALIGVGVATRRHLRHSSNVENKHIELLEERIRQLETEIGDRHE